MNTREAARAIEEGAVITRRAVGRIGADMFLVWGVVYVLAPLSALMWAKADFWPGLILVGLGIAATIVVSARSPVQSEQGWKVGFLWGVLYAFAGVWIIILVPPPYDVRPEKLWAFYVSVAMLAYVVMGLWSYWPLLLIGGAVTICQVIGLFLFLEWFWIWTALTGGGILLAAGIILRLEMARATK